MSDDVQARVPSGALGAVGAAGALEATGTAGAAGVAALVWALLEATSLGQVAGPTIPSQEA